MSSKWSTSLFDCCNYPTTTACCCLPFTLLHTVHKEHNSNNLTCIHCTLLSISLGSYLIDPLLGSLLYQTNIISLTSALRSHVRDTENIVSDQTCSDQCYDVSVTAVCPALSLAQVIRQTEDRNKAYAPVVEYKIERT